MIRESESRLVDKPRISLKTIDSSRNAAIDTNWTLEIVSRRPKATAVDQVSHILAQFEAAGIGILSAHT
jgi:hypothetical protein